MTKQALYDAFMSGHNWTCAHDGEGMEAAQRGFEEWYANAVATGDRKQHDPEPETPSYVGEWERQRDIETEGQKAAIYHGGEAKRRRKQW